MDELRLRVAESALHDTAGQHRQNDDTTDCHPGTRWLLLQQLVESPVSTKHLIQWLRGPAGAGKTSVMRSTAKRLEERGEFLGGFFFRRSDGSRNNLNAFFPTLAVQLAKNYPSTLPFIEEAMQEDKHLLDKSLKTQMETLIIAPILGARHDNPSATHPRIFIIDGLDECDLAGQHEFLEVLLLILISRLSHLRITIFVSSLAEESIDSQFKLPQLNNLTNRIFLEPSRQDIRQYLDGEFDEINRLHPGLKDESGGRWPRAGDVGFLEDKSYGYFILIETVMRYLRLDNLRGRAPDERLRDVLQALRAEPLHPLDALYLFILRENAPEDPAEFEEWKTCIGLACIPFNDFSDWTEAFGDDAFRLLYGRHRPEVERTMKDFGPLFYVDDKTGQPRNYHSSLPDCVFNAERSAEFAIDFHRLHERIACTIVGTLSTFQPLAPPVLTPLLPYRRILSDHLLHHFTYSPTPATGGKIDVALGKVDFRQLFSSHHDVYQTLALSGVMWTGISAQESSLFHHPCFASLSHHHQPMKAKLRALLNQYLHSVKFDETTDYFPLFDLLGRLYLDASIPMEAFIHHWLTSLRSRLRDESRSLMDVGEYGYGYYTSTVKYEISLDIEVMVDDIDIPRFRLFSHIFNDNFALHCAELFVREMPPDGTWLSLETYDRAGYQVFLLLYSAPQQRILTRIWDMCSLNAVNNPIDVSFDASRQSLRDTYPLETRVSILQYYNLCSQAGLRPEGLPVALESTWRNLSSRCPVPAGSSTVSTSFPKAIPPSFSVVFSSLSLSVSRPSGGSPNPSPRPHVNFSKHDSQSATTTFEKLPVLIKRFFRPKLEWIVPFILGLITCGLWFTFFAPVFPTLYVSRFRLYF